MALKEWEGKQRASSSSLHQETAGSLEDGVTEGSVGAPTMGAGNPTTWSSIVSAGILTGNGVCSFVILFVNLRFNVKDTPLCRFIHWGHCSKFRELDILFVLGVSFQNHL